MRIFLLVVCIIGLTGFAPVLGQSIKYGNNETDDYSGSQKSDDFTYLLWDRNDGGDGNFNAGSTPKFFYWDNDDSKLHFLLDTGNMSQLDAEFNSVGIGSSNPAAPLHVYESSNASGTTMILDADVDQNPNLKFTLNGQDLANIRVDERGGDQLQFRVGDGSQDHAMSITPQGNVGIGTTNPTEPLHIYESSNTSTGQTMRLDADVDQNPNVVFSSNGQNMANIRVKDSGGDQLQFLVGGSLDEAMSITPAGNVGIGTVNPSTLLTINGTAKAEEIIVEEDTGADFVFEEGYKLTSLPEVEEHINEHKHLPEIPTAREMKKNGVRVGNLQMKLLQKIEELTLYTISQKKKIESQGKVIKQLLKRVKKLEKELNNE